MRRHATHTTIVPSCCIAPLRSTHTRSWPQLGHQNFFIVKYLVWL
jgi:hypothetical protein